MYLALYRKYRPRTFDDVISQPHITTTLKNQLISGQHPHAYLFTGSRGTGKTSCAKILAKAINCLSPKDGNPCLVCEACRLADEGVTDITEMDAASNNGVEDVRILRAEISYTPIHLRYRVYIIDEVHMLSQSAFNALLKTLEEPPAHAVFILATTESHKIPPTISSRCQCFAFRRIDENDSAKRLMEVAQKENATLQENAARLIARLSDGAMRDALSLLDQCISTSETVTVETVRNCAHVAGSEHLFAFADAVVKQDPAACLLLFDALYRAGKEPARLIEELLLHYRNLMLIQSVPERMDLVSALPDEIQKYKEQATAYTPSGILRAMEILTACEASMAKTKQRKIPAELCFIRLCTPALDTDGRSILARMEQLEYAVSQGETNQTQKPSSPPKKETQPADELPFAYPPPPVMTDEEIALPPPPEPSSPQPSQTAVTHWGMIVDELPPHLSGLLEYSKAYYDGNRIVIQVKDYQKPIVSTDEAKNEIKKAVFTVLKQAYLIDFVTIEPQKTAVDTPSVLETFLKKAEENGIRVERKP